MSGLHVPFETPNHYFDGWTVDIGAEADMCEPRPLTISVENDPERKSSKQYLLRRDEATSGTVA